MTTAAQSFVSSYAPRLRQYANSLLQPAPQIQSLTTGGRTTKRGTAIINYADDAYDDDDFDDSETGTRRLTGLRSLRREDLERKEAHADKYGREIDKPVDLQPIYRDWMVRRHVYPMTDREERPPNPPNPSHLPRGCVFLVVQLARIIHFPRSVPGTNMAW
ncbi:hypothetical protein DV735_g3891, partial [Chaetothyriales sp. CBS 134920]